MASRSQGREPCTVALIPHPRHRQLLPHVGYHLPGTTASLNPTETTRSARTISRALAGITSTWRMQCLIDDERVQEGKGSGCHHRGSLAYNYKSNHWKSCLYYGRSIQSSFFCKQEQNEEKRAGCVCCELFQRKPANAARPTRGALLGSPKLLYICSYCISLYYMGYLHHHPTARRTTQSVTYVTMAQSALASVAMLASTDIESTSSSPAATSTSRATNQRAAAPASASRQAT
ncbi:hypothetical protein BB8028_0011g00310 [Beauveria bassiana]|uniref:Uncharacterized protein n=1 Tax=Beauveria bassiana TaxID=176275 RepID=A0A2S7YQK4_BEABA|nr:hypothetical protein BB8028_0011g00310 [Beauveria bassiana]